MNIHSTKFSFNNVFVLSFKELFSINYKFLNLCCNQTLCCVVVFLCETCSIFTRIQVRLWKKCVSIAATTHPLNQPNIWLSWRLCWDFFISCRLRWDDLISIYVWNICFTVCKNLSLLMMCLVLLWATTIYINVLHWYCILQEVKFYFQQ